MLYTIRIGLMHLYKGDEMKMISGFKIFLGVLLIILGIGIYIYLKRKKENRQVMDTYKTNQMKNNSTRNPLQYD